MPWTGALSLDTSAPNAAAEVSAAVRAALGEGPPDLVVAFFCGHGIEEADEIRSVLQRELLPGCLAGVSAAGVISGGSEIETGTALSVLAARLPEGAVTGFLMEGAAWSSGIDSEAAFHRAAPGAAEAELGVVLGDPFSLDPAGVLDTFAQHAPGLRLVGGMASAAQRPGGNALFLNDWLSPDGGIGLVFSRAMRADVVVSQGCRSLGPVLEVSETQENLVVKLDGMPALERVEQVIRGVPREEQERLSKGLFLGRPVRRDRAGRGDYLVRNLTGADRKSGVIAVADTVARGERVRLHVRDAGTARQDLEMLLLPQGFDTHAEAALVFSCNGRGRHLFGEPDVDSGLVQSALGGAPAAGFFCAGEIGPVGAQNFLHGHTASVAILRSR